MSAGRVGRRALCLPSLPKCRKNSPRRNFGWQRGRGGSPGDRFSGQQPSSTKENTDKGRDNQWEDGTHASGPPPGPFWARLLFTVLCTFVQWVAGIKKAYH